MKISKGPAPRSFSEVGFTLLELLVVIGIIAVLVSMGFASYSTAQKKSRDAKRQGNLKAFQNTLEQCYSVNSYKYPIVTGGGTTSITVDCSAKGIASLTVTDPTTKNFTVTSTDSEYTISIPLETTTTNFTITQLQ